MNWKKFNTYGAGSAENKETEEQGWERWQEHQLNFWLEYQKNMTQWHHDVLQVAKIAAEEYVGALNNAPYSAEKRGNWWDFLHFFSALSPCFQRTTPQNGESCEKFAPWPLKAHAAQDNFRLPPFLNFFSPPHCFFSAPTCPICTALEHICCSVNAFTPYQKSSETYCESMGPLSSHALGHFLAFLEAMSAKQQPTTHSPFPNASQGPESRKKTDCCQGHKGWGQPQEQAWEKLWQSLREQWAEWLLSQGPAEPNPRNKEQENTQEYFWPPQRPPLPKQ